MLLALASQPPWLLPPKRRRQRGGFAYPPPPCPPSLSRLRLRSFAWRSAEGARRRRSQPVTWSPLAPPRWPRAPSPSDLSSPLRRWHLLPASMEWGDKSLGWLPCLAEDPPPPLASWPRGGDLARFLGRWLGQIPSLILDDGIGWGLRQAEEPPFGF